MWIRARLTSIFFYSFLFSSFISYTQEKTKIDSIKKEVAKKAFKKLIVFMRRNCNIQK